MGLWKYQECIALYWNKSGCAYGVRVNIKNQKIQVLDAESFDAEDGFAVAISEITEKLLQPTTHLIVAGGNLEGSVCFDLSIPPMAASDIKQAIVYELPRHIPCNPMEITFGYRILQNPDPENTSKRMLIRVLAVLKKDWNELITEFTSLGIKIDVFMHPYMAIDPLLGDVDELYLPDIEEDFTFIKDESSGSRSMIRIDPSAEQPIPIPDVTLLPEKLNYEPIPKKITESLESFIPPLLMASYSLGKEFNEDKNHLIPLPKELVPERFRCLRISFAILLAFALLLVFGLIGRYWWDAWSRLDELKVEQKNVQNKIRSLQDTNAKLDSIDQLITEIEETKIGNSGITRCLHKLTQKIPKDMWLSHLSTKGNKINLNIKSAGGKKSSLQSLLNNTGMFKTTTSYTRRSTDGTESITIHLDVINASAKKEGK